MNMGTLQSNALIKAGLIIGVSLVLGLLFDYFFYADQNVWIPHN